MTHETSQTETPDQQPLVGRFVHLAVVFGAIAGCGLLGWSLGTGASSYLFGLTLPVFASLMWFGTSVLRDPERSRFARLTIPGSLRLIVELALIVAGGIGIWAVWNRAASETFLTLAALDSAVRYQRIAILMRTRRG